MHLQLQWTVLRFFSDLEEICFLRSEEDKQSVAFADAHDYA